MKKRISLILSIVILSVIIFAACEKDDSLRYFIDVSACTGCGDCQDACIYDAIEVIGNKAVIDQSKCTQCGDCIKECPNDAIN